MMKRMALTLFALAALTSCVQHDLCYDHGSTYSVITRFNYDLEWHESYDIYDEYDEYDLEWMHEMPTELEDYSRAVTPSEPDGIRIQVIKDGERYSTNNVGTSSGTIRLEPGVYSLLFYNNDTESIVFDNDYSEAGSYTATTRTRTRSTYFGNPLVVRAIERTVTEPDMLFYHYIESFNPDDYSADDVIDVEMKPAVFTYLISFNFSHGFEYVALARGTLAGMAESVSLIDGKASDEAVTILFDCDVTSECVTASVRSFGIPSYLPEETVIDEDGNLTITDPNLFGLNLEVKLKNGVTKTFNFDITDQMSLQPNGGVITVNDIEISDEDGKTGGSAFDVDVEGWGDYEDIVLPLTK